MKFLYLIIPFILSGCFYQTANHVDIQKSIDFCKGPTNIDNLTINMTGDETVYCIDGTSTNIDRYKLKKPL